MTQLNPYLNFKGNCREAMSFYHTCLGGELNLQTVGESPMAEGMPEEMKQKILHSILVAGSLIIMGSDMIGQGGFIEGNNVSLCLNFVSEKEIKLVFSRLSSGGQITHELAEMFWGATFGAIVDKFGINWLFNYDNGRSDSVTKDREVPVLING